jgi:hypothetical protein
LQSALTYSSLTGMAMPATDEAVQWHGLALADIQRELG